MSNRQVSGSVEIDVEGIGGIDSTTVSLGEGINLLEGRNATNRTSLLQAIMAAMGSEQVSLKADRDEGSVELSIHGESYTRTLERTDAGVVFGGDPYLTDPTEADLFAFLLETNEVRQAVKTGGDLREIIMRPVDTVEIEQRIRSQQSDRREIDSRIERLERERERLPELEERRTELRRELEETRTELAEARAELEEVDTTVEEKKRFEETLAELKSVRSDFESVEYRLETEREALASAEEELKSVQSERTESVGSVGEQIASLDDEIDRLREQKRSCDARVSELNRIVQFNEQLLDGDGELAELFDDDDDDITGELMSNGQRTCWTCGSEVSKSEIEDMLDRLRELSHTQRRQRSELAEELDELKTQRDQLKTEREKRERMTERVDSLRADIERREESIAELEAEKEELERHIEELEAEAQTYEDVSESRVLEVHRTINKKEIAIENAEANLAEVAGEIERLEAKAEEIDDLEEKREQINERLTDLRTRIERLESEAVESFNEHMAALVDLLEYENLARVWVERQGGGPDTDTTFVLHIVRTREDGASYEDELNHLSESEREVIGLVFALAGYLVHDVYDDQPFLLLDSLEAIDSERIALLIEYFEEYAPTIVAALLPEDTRLLDESVPRIRDI